MAWGEVLRIKNTCFLLTVHKTFLLNLG
uniref:Uncharacterized protein n=1 Tax=Rhizophora mucronata TaxID=61149 RepID=A0A2P2QWA5_RHIMU